MKKSFIGILSTGLLASSTLVGQLTRPPAQPTYQVGTTTPLETHDENLTRFNLNFPGGTPSQLVEAIVKASGKPLNAIIPDELANTKLPPLKMNNVDVARLFLALSEASERQVAYTVGNPPGQIQRYPETYGFRTQPPIKDDSVWYFYNQRAPIPEFLKPKDCRFYQLAPYLETYKVEDITTAIQTGWKMLSETNLPTLSYHKDTKLLIAVGDPIRLQLIDAVLQQLAKAKPQPVQEGLPHIERERRNTVPPQ